MTGDERLINFIHSLEPDRSPVLEKIRREALDADVPVVRDETAALLKCFMKAFRPENVLEIGTAVGYSLLTMAEAAPAGTHFTTIENYEPRIMMARQNLLNSPYSDRIRMMETDADDALAVLFSEKAAFDFVFLDAAKAQYGKWLPTILSLMKDGGILISDNVLQNGTITESRYQVERRDRTIHTRMREYLFALKHTEGLTTSILPVGDGISFTVKDTAS